MKHVEDFSDERHKAFCVHCGGWLPSGEDANRDHVPTRALLRRPYPDNLPVIRVCRRCNEGFSTDEEYVATFLAVVLSGTTAPPPTEFPGAARTLGRRDALRERIAASRGPDVSVGGAGATTATWRPEEERVRRVLLKNARGHAMHELGEPMLAAPSTVVFAPLPLLRPEERTAFEAVSIGDVWPEVGSRLLTRLVEGTDLRDDGWIAVQDGWYRYAILLEGGAVEVRIVIAEYLAATVTWDTADG